MIDTSSLRRLFRVPVAVSADYIANLGADLYPVEQIAVQNGGAKRRQEFAAGRECARRALEALGCRRGPIPVNRDRTPCWPVGYIGSISHSDEICCAVVTDTRMAIGIGVDVESSSPLETELVHLVCSPAELELLAALPFCDGVDWPKVMFGAKEAFYKAAYPILGEFLDFLDVRVEIEIEAGECGGRFRALPALSDRFSDSRIDNVLGRWIVIGRALYCGAAIDSNASKGA